MNIVVTEHVGAVAVTAEVFRAIPDLGVDNQILFMISVPKNMPIELDGGVDMIKSVGEFREKCLRPTARNPCPKCGQEIPPRRSILP
jgi:hypothetical protein